MSYYISKQKLVLMLALVLASSLAAADRIPLELPPQELPAKADLIPWQLKPYPTFVKSPGDVGSWLFHRPAGKHGAIKAQPDGTLQFADGTPARFWGTTTCFAMTFPDTNAEIEALADAIANRGYNLVRFHHNDINRVGLGYLQMKPKSNSKLDPVGMDRLDRFAAELIKRGIYIYLDLIDYRSLLEEDGIFQAFPDMKPMAKSNQGWKGLFPHPAIVTAWKRATSVLLAHKNPYTGRTWAEEPAVVSIEIINENGPFWDWSFKVSGGVRKWYDQEWNRWLLKRYRTRDALAVAWTNGEGKASLFDDEDPAKGTVFRPRLSNDLKWDRPHRSRSRGIARVNDYYAYLADTTIGFFKQAKEHIRGSGFHGLVIGSHEKQGPIDRYAQSTTGCVAAHLYAPGTPAWGARPTSAGISLSGVDITANNWFSNIPRVKVQGLPGINGEWTGGSICYRADANIAVAAITAYQGLTQSLHFSYGHRWVGEKQPNWDTLYKYRAWAKRIGRTFTYTHAIPWMMVNRICSPLFVRGDFKKPRYTVHLAYSKEDRHEQTKHALGQIGGSGTVGGAANFLPILHNVESYFFDTVCESKADVVFMTGRTASGDYSKCKHAVLIGDNPWRDSYHKKRDLGAPARTVHKTVKVVNLDAKTTFKVNAPWASAKTISFASLEGAIERMSLPQGAEPIGVSTDERYVLGWLDDRFLVLPNGNAFGKQIGDRQWLYRLYLHACKRWGMDISFNSPESHTYYSDTREFAVDWAFGTVAINTEKTQGLSGFIGWRPENKTTNLRCSLRQPYGNVLITAADNKPLAISQRMLLVAVGRMANTGQVVGPVGDGKVNVLKAGKAPTLVEALRGKVALQHTFSDRLTVYALNPTGQRLGKVETVAKDGVLSFELSPKWKSIWFEITETGKEASVNTGTPWASTEISAAPVYPKPELVRLEAFLTTAGKKTIAESTDTSKLGALQRLWWVRFNQGKGPGKYGNTKVQAATDLQKGKVVRVQYGKVTNGWHGGWWQTFAVAAERNPADIAGVFLVCKGDGTLPRECYLTLKTKKGIPYRSRNNLNQIFEKDSWYQWVWKTSDFIIDPGFKKKHPDMSTLPAKLDLSTIARVDLACIGPLMAQKSVLHIEGIGLLLNPQKEEKPQSLKGILPKATPLSSAEISIPYLPDVAIKADGKPDEACWQKALCITMDESHVPDWHFFGTHVVKGERRQGEGASFWVLANSKGLGLIAVVRKGEMPIVSERNDWWMNDCVEIFTDTSGAGEKPDKQIFLAYRQSDKNKAAASDPSIQIGRMKTETGYLLEVLLPWKSLGFNGLPKSTFGLEFQLDIAAPGKGRVLQMGFGTATNEAWISAKHYLKAKLKQ